MQRCRGRAELGAWEELREGWVIKAGWDGAVQRERLAGGKGLEKGQGAIEGH